MIFQYKIGGRTRRIGLGNAVPEVFPDVRKLAATYTLKVIAGVDPQAEKEAAIAEAKTVERFDKARERFLAFYKGSVRPRTYTETARYLKGATSLQDRAITDISKRDVASALSSCASNSGPVAANRLQSSLSSMFAWCVTEGLIEENPAIGTTKRKETPRDRSVVRVKVNKDGNKYGDISELVQVWRALDDGIAGDIIKLLILTGARKMEIAGLRWDELNEDLTHITLPAHRCKNAREHIIPLSEPARDILTRQHRIVGWQCVFSASDHGFQQLAHHKAVLDAQLPDIPAWHLHDLRRSCATGMATLGVLPHVVEAVLNHQSGSKSGVAGVYNVATYLPEKTAALTLWAEHITAAVSGDSAKVVPLKKLG